MEKKHYKDHLIIIRRFVINENDLLLTCYSYLFGKCLVKANGSKRILSKYIGKMEPLSVIQAEIYNSGKSLTLTNATLELAGPMAPSLQTFTVAQKICKIIIENIEFNERNQKIFKLLYECIIELNNDQKPEIVWQYFKTKFLQFNGNLPTLNKCSICNLQIETSSHYAQTLTCSKCTQDRNHRTISLNGLKSIHFFSTRNNVHEANKLKIPNETLQEIDTFTEALINHSS